MPQLLHFLKVDQGTLINKFKCLDPSSAGASGASDIPDSSPLSNEKDVFINKSNEVMKPINKAQ